ncbi:hypothetical protein AA103193_2401 [Tanticharoenia sakaeratensis NBRC 103193]|nr:hypothetical protein AA103193_2401 [Tanticharoenia sakaeratensis NBRC 103193]
MNAEIVQRLEESLYLSGSAQVLAGTELSDAERALVDSWRKIDGEARRSLGHLLNALTHKSAE